MGQTGRYHCDLESFWLLFYGLKRLKERKEAKRQNSLLLFWSKNAIRMTELNLPRDTMPAKENLINCFDTMAKPDIPLRTNYFKTFYKH